MHLTRTGYNMVVAIWLLPLVLIDIIGNTTATDTASDFYYGKILIDGVLFAYAVWQCFRPTTMSVAQSQRNNHVEKSDEVVSFENLAAYEWIYCLALTFYALGNLIVMHEVNKHATGLVSLGTLLWSLMSIIVAVLSARQFYQIKSGAIQQLKQKVVN